MDKTTTSLNNPVYASPQFMRGRDVFNGGSLPAFF
jgi:hypothetical protein